MRLQNKKQEEITKLSLCGKSQMNSHMPQPPLPGIRSRQPQALQCTASGSWRCSAHWGQRKKTFGDRKSDCASRARRLMPEIMTTIEVSFPQGPGNTISPNPVVVAAVTVKYRAST